MERFLINIFKYKLVFVTTVLVIFIINNKSLDIKKLFFYDKVLFKKTDYFEAFLKSKSSINLILGSSITEDSIIPDYLGGNWFSFASPRQNINNSFDILDHYKDVIKIDTMIVGLQPFDFPCSYTMEIKDNLPYQNKDLEFYYGKGKMRYSKREFQTIIDNIFPSFFERPSLKNKNIFYDVRSKQGYSGRNYKVMKNVDSLYLNQDQTNRVASKYFYNVKEIPNMDYFDKFKRLSDSLNIKVVYLLTPKSVYYRLDMKKYNYDKIWNNILDSLKAKGVEVWDYEDLMTDFQNFIWAVDDVHLTNDGAKYFSKIIIKRLKK